jgi:hypothetical protein
VCVFLNLCTATAFLSTCNLHLGHFILEPEGVKLDRSIDRSIYLSICLSVCLSGSIYSSVYLSSFFLFPFCLTFSCSSHCLLSPFLTFILRSSFFVSFCFSVFSSILTSFLSLLYFLFSLCVLSFRLFPFLPVFFFSPPPFCFCNYRHIYPIISGSLGH